MSIEQTPHTDLIERPRPIPDADAPLSRESASTSNAGFNSDYYSAMRATPSTARLHDMLHPITDTEQRNPRVTDAGASAQRRDVPAKISDASPAGSGSDATPPGIKFERKGTSDAFYEGAKKNFSAAFDKLTPEAQRSLQGLKVTVSGEPPRGIHGDTPGFYTPPPNDNLHIIEGPTKRQKERPENVVNHEIGHPLDKRNGYFSQSPEFAKAFDQAVKALPPNLRRQMHGEIRSSGLEMGRAEVFADLVSLNMGTRPEQLRYLPSEFHPAFKGASDLVKKKVLQMIRVVNGILQQGGRNYG